jgi:SAM-dependent methyltransferase
MNDTGGAALSVDRAGLRLLCCPACEGALAAAGNRVACAACGSDFSRRDEIIDFVAGAASTALDEIDYDQHYTVNLSASQHLRDSIARLAGGRWPTDFGDVAEIGCGTGGFTMAFLSGGTIGHAVLTDVSVKMLRICRARLERMGGQLRTRGLTFATFSGTEACLAPAAFDTCYGTAVLHHIIDWPLALKRIHALLKPGGRAFFMEPALPFHRALTSTLADVLAVWIRDGSVPGDQIDRAASWLAEVHCNAANSGDVEVLAEREDKHQFVAEDVESVARAAGFAVADAMPLGPDPAGTDTIGVYLRQAGLDDATFVRLWQAWPAAQARHFSRLAERDRAPSYVFWLEKGRRKTAGRRTGPPPPPPSALAFSDVALRLWLQLRIEQRADGSVLTVTGWCVAAEPLKSIEVTAGTRTVRLPIWMPRPDVLNAVNGDGIYPSLHALCSGIEGQVVLAGAPAGSVSVDLAALGVEGGRLMLETATVEPDGATRQVDLSIRAGDR